MKFPTVYYDDNGNAIAGPEIEAESMEDANVRLRLLAAYDPADGMPKDATETWFVRHGNVFHSGTIEMRELKDRQEYGARFHAAIHTNVVGDYPQAANEFFAPAYQEEE